MFDKLLTAFYYLQFKVTSLFHVSNQQAAGIVVLFFLTLLYLIVTGLIALRVFLKTGDRRARTIRGDSILLLGPCDSGKTAFFYMLTQGKFPNTVTSIKENIVSITRATIGSNSEEEDSDRVIGKVVDIPGHPSMRIQIEKQIPQAAGIIYMIDGTQYDVKEIAESLYDLFVNPAFVAHPCPLLLAINKTDLAGCEDNQVVFKKIEKELDLIKESRGSVEAVGESNANKLGVEGQQFTFEEDAPCEVYACNCSVKDRNIHKITGFISVSLH